MLKIISQCREWARQVYYLASIWVKTAVPGYANMGGIFSVSGEGRFLSRSGVISQLRVPSRSDLTYCDHCNLQQPGAELYVTGIDYDASNGQNPRVGRRIISKFG
jgi:hypothetical protein